MGTDYTLTAVSELRLLLIKHIIADVVCFRT